MATRKTNTAPVANDQQAQMFAMFQQFMAAQNAPKAETKVETPKVETPKAKKEVTFLDIAVGQEFKATLEDGRKVVIARSKRSGLTFVKLA